MSCEAKMTQGHRGTCGNDVAGFSKIWQINRKDITNIIYDTVNTDIVKSFELVSGAHAYDLPFMNESVKPDYSLVVNPIGKARYKNSVEINTVARTAMELKALTAGDQVLIFELKQTTAGGGKYVAYGFDCGMFPTSETNAQLKSGTILKIESYGDQTEPLQLRIINNVSDSATRLMLDGFLAS